MTTLEKKQLLMGTLVKYRRWVEDGSKPYGYDKDQQLFFDTCHEGLRPTQEDPSLWAWSIQMSDSPEGDDWWHGTCRFLNSDTDVEIVEEWWTRH